MLTNGEGSNNDERFAYMTNKKVRNVLLGVSSLCCDTVMELVDYGAYVNLFTVQIRLSPVNPVTSLLLLACCVVNKGESDGSCLPTLKAISKGCHRVDSKRHGTADCS